MYFEEAKDGLLLRVRLSPNSSCCAIKGVFEVDWLKVSVVSVPEKGRANKELIDFLAKKLKIAKSEMEIISGELDRYKKILIKNKDKEVEERVMNLGKDN